jgi:general secretion pathway protein J
MKMHANKNPQSGFTLIEMLLAISLMAMLLGLAYGGLRAATKATSSGQDILEVTGKIRITHQFIRRQLNQMQPLAFDVSGDSEQSPIVFEGSNERIQFVAPMPGYLGQGGPQVQYLQFVPGQDGLDLIFSHQLLQSYDPAYMIEREPIVLLEGIQQAGFEFLTTDENGELAGWTAHWDSPGDLPAAVHVDLELGEDGNPVWPLLVTSVRIDGFRGAREGSAYSNAIQDLIREPREEEK